MSELLTHKFAMFFFWAFLDDKKAIENASSAFEIYKKRIQNNNYQNVECISAIHKIWIKNSSGYVRSKSRINASAGWKFKKQIDFSPWSIFLKTASPDEIEVVILAQILKFNTEDIAKALQLSEGSIRYRIGKSLRKLGASIESQDNSFDIQGFRR